MLTMLSHAGIHSLLTMIVAVLPLGAGIAYLVRPSEQRLALMRPLSLAGIFAGLSGTVGGFLHTFRMVAVRDTPVPTNILAVAAAESLVPLFVACSCLMIAWLLAALGLRRHP